MGIGPPQTGVAQLTALVQEVKTSMEQLVATQNTRALYVQAADQSVTGTTALTLLNQTANNFKGGLTVPLEILNKGLVITLEVRGTLQADLLAQTLTLVLRLGSTVVNTLTIPGLVNLATGRRFTLESTIVVQEPGATGRVRGHSVISYNTIISGVPAVGEFSVDNSADTPTNINLTTPQALSLTAAWSSASATNRITSTVGVLRVTNL